MVNISSAVADVRGQTQGQQTDSAPSPALAPTALALILLVIALFSEGAFSLRHWAPLAIFCLVALACVRTYRPRAGSQTLVLAVWAYALWTLLSALWADSPGAAIQGGARNLLYAALVALPLLALPDRPRALRLAGALTGALAALTAFTLIDAASGTSAWLAGRLNAPVGYRNGTAALFAMAFWPLLSVAARRDGNPLVRAGALAVATTALGLAFLTQSRGVLLGFVCGAVVVLVLGPDRLRRAWLAVLAVGALAFASDDLLAPWHTFVDVSATVPAATRHATRTLAWVATAAFAAGLLLAVFDGGLRVSATLHRRIRAVACVALGLLSIAVVAGGVAKTGNPVTLVRDKVNEFKQLDAPAPGETRLGSTGGQRYDLWRVAWKEWTSDPVAGVGEGSYAAGYYAQRRTDRNLSTPHSLPIGALAETGVVGLLLLLAIPLSAALAIGRGWQATPPPARRAASAMATSGTVLLAQAMVDWLWLIPGLAGLGLMCLALAVAVVVLPDAGVVRAAPRPPWRVALSAASLVAALLIAALYVSDLDVRIARSQRATSPAAALESARNARRLNPFALSPRYLEAGALESMRRRDEARAALEDALRLEPDSFATMGLIGDLEMRAGNDVAARAWYRRALALNPRDVGLRQLAGR